MPPLWLISSVGGLVLSIAAWFAGSHDGAEGVRAEWAARDRADKDAADISREVSRVASHAAATKYEAQRAEKARRATNPSPESEYELHRSICPPPGALGRPLEFGDVPVDRAWLDRLRGAGADF